MLIYILSGNKRKSCTSVFPQIKPSIACYRQFLSYVDFLKQDAAAIIFGQIKKKLHKEKKLKKYMYNFLSFQYSIAKYWIEHI